MKNNIIYYKRAKIKRRSLQYYQKYYSKIEFTLNRSINFLFSKNIREIEVVYHYSTHCQSLIYYK